MPGASHNTPPSCGWRLLQHNAVLVLLVLLVSVGNSAEEVNFVADTFHEELLLRPLSDGRVMAHFQFTARTSKSLDRPDSFNHFNLFPRAMGQIVHDFRVRELHLTLTQGRWIQEQWGEPFLAAPVGAELFSWLATDGNATLADELWKGLTAALAGVFCASLHFMDGVVTSSPINSLHPAALAFWDEELSLRHAKLPRELVCTENLTPWLKFLPCREVAGLGQLLTPTRIYDSHFHSMGTHIRPVCADVDCESSLLELSQTLTVVLDTSVDRAVLRRDWTLAKLFQLSVPLVACPVATASTVFVHLPPSDEQKPIRQRFTINPPPPQFLPVQFYQDEENPGRLAVYDLRGLSGAAGFPLEMSWDDPLIVYGEDASPYRPSSVVVSRHLTGHGYERGGISVVVSNPNQHQSVHVTFFDSIPWYLRLYFHTLQLSLVSSAASIQLDPETDFEFFRVVPAEERKSPSVLEFALVLSPNCSVVLHIEFEKAFLHWTEHPPDAHRGFDIGAAVVTARYLPLTSPLSSASTTTISASATSSSTAGTDTAAASSTATSAATSAASLSDSPPSAIWRDNYVHWGRLTAGLEWSPLLPRVPPSRGDGDNANAAVTDSNILIFEWTASACLYTAGLLVMLPTPDFSMPYNVITLSGTVWALFFGSLFNTLMRRYGDLRHGAAFKSDRPIIRLARYFLSWGSSIRAAPDSGVAGPASLQN